MTIPCSGGGRGDTTLLDCLAAFFAPEHVQYVCESETKARMARSAAAAAEAKAKSAATITRRHSHPRRQSGKLSSAGHLSRHKMQVSWSEGPHTVVMIPGSSEQRGTDLPLAARGHAAFSRPMVHNGAALVVTAQLDQVALNRLRLCLGPHDMELTTVSVLDYTLQLGSVIIPRVREQDNVEEQARAAGAAQLLMDCIADIVAHHGLKGPSYSVLKNMTRGMVLEVEVAGASHSDPPVFCSAECLKTNNGDDSSSGSGIGEVAPNGRMRVVGPLVRGIGPEGSELWHYPEAVRGPSPSDAAPPLTADDTGSESSDSSSASGTSVSAFSSQHTLYSQHTAASDTTVEAGDEDYVTGISGHSNGDGTEEKGQVPVLLRVAAEQAYPSTGLSKVIMDHSLMDSLDMGASESCSEVDGNLQPTHPASISGASSSCGADKTEMSETGRKAWEEAKVERIAVKSYALANLPPLLWLHLKRFQQDKRGASRKVACHVAFPFHLDMAPFGTGDDVSSQLYQLAGIVEHSGSMQSGHYVALVQRGMLSRPMTTTVATPLSGDTIGGDRESPQVSTSANSGIDNGGSGSCNGRVADPKPQALPWWRVSDTHVKKVSWAEVEACQAYLLLYVRCQGTVAAMS